MKKIIQGKKGRDTYIYDSDNMTVTDKIGNTIKLFESFDDIPESNLSYYLDSLFHRVYAEANELKELCKHDKIYKTVWSDW